MQSIGSAAGGVCAALLNQGRRRETSSCLLRSATRAQSLSHPVLPLFCRLPGTNEAGE